MTQNSPILTTTRNALLDPLQTVTGIVERRSTMPILSNVLIENSRGQTSILGTDLEIQTRTTAVNSNDDPDFRLTLNAKKLQDILRTLPDQAPVRFYQKANSQLELRSGKGKYTLETLPAEDFPLMNVESGVKACFSMRQDALREMLSQVQYAMAVQDIRFYLNGLLMQAEGNMLRLVATDGHRLAYTQHTIDANLPPCEVILPRKTIAELLKLLSFPEELVTVDFLESQIRFSARNTIVVSKIVEGKFPDYNRVIPQDNDKIFQLSRVGFLTTLERVAILADDKTKAVNLHIAPGLMLIKYTNGKEEAQEELEIAYQGVELEINFNVQYLTDVLRNLHSDDVKMAFGDSTRSMLLTMPDNGDFKYIVMPMSVEIV